MTYSILTYQKDLQLYWDDFIKRSANGTFLHLRPYMDYHADRFDDASLLIYEGLKIKAVLPAHRIEKALFAHNGLTYSDFIFHKKLKLSHKVDIIRQVLHHLHNNGIEKIHIKSIPFFYHTQIDESNAYIYFKAGAKISLIKPFFVIMPQNGSRNNHNREKNMRKLQDVDYQLLKSPEWLPEFWEIVQENLQSRYQTAPVHSLEEMQMLMQRFPDNIKLYGVQLNGKLLAGALTYFINQTVHFQYIHSVQDTTHRKAVEWLTYKVIENFQDYNYISFGSSETGKNQINGGLAYWKESFGSRILNQFFYEIDTQNHHLLNDTIQ